MSELATERMALGENRYALHGVLRQTILFHTIVLISSKYAKVWVFAPRIIPTTLYMEASDVKA